MTKSIAESFMKYVIKEKISTFIPYLATLYYLEIIFLMVFLNFLYGKTVSVSVAILLSSLLTLHVIRLFLRSDLNRKIQLYLMDLHIAYSIAYIFNKCFSGGDITYIDGTVIFFRVILSSFEIAAVLILTDSNIKKGFSN